MSKKCGRCRGSGSLGIPLSEYSRFSKFPKCPDCNGTGEQPENNDEIRKAFEVSCYPEKSEYCFSMYEIGRNDGYSSRDKEITELKESTYGYINLIKDLTKENKRLKEDLKLYKGMVV